jgi:hypothetical protein
VTDPPIPLSTSTRCPREMLTLVSWSFPDSSIVLELALDVGKWTGTDLEHYDKLYMADFKIAAIPAGRGTSSIDTGSHIETDGQDVRYYLTGNVFALERSVEASSNDP